jgi:sRNA-binding protein
MRHRYCALQIVLVVLIPVLAGAAATEEDKAVCRKENPGPAAHVAQAYMACLSRRTEAAGRAIYEAQQKEYARQRLEEALAREERSAEQERNRLVAQAAREAALEAQRAEAAEEERITQEEEREKEAVLRKECGKDFHKLRVGMIWTRVQKCSGLESFEVVSEDRVGRVYEADGGFIRVEKGKVVRWIAPP